MMNTDKIFNILLVEDDDDDFDIFYSVVSSLPGKFRILRTSNGVTLCSLIQTSLKPGIIFLDINMPYKDGFACLEEIKTIENYKPIKVVMYSGSGNAKEIEKCYSLGADFFLVKPSCYSSAQQQLIELFQNNYFVGNMKPPREEFVFNSAKSNTDKGNSHLSHAAAVA